jgi:hypothetical protein
MLAAFSNWSGLASNFDVVFEKCSLLVHSTPGADMPWLFFCDGTLETPHRLSTRKMEAPLQCPT